MFLSVEDCLPEDISTAVKTWSSPDPPVSFPGQAGTLAAKNAWARRFWNDEHLTAIPQAHVLARILYDCCPDKVTLLLFVQRSDVAHFDWTPEQGKVFLTSKEHRPSPHPLSGDTAADIAQYKEWIAQESDTGSDLAKLNPTIPTLSDLVLLASMPTEKGDLPGDQADALLDHLGIKYGSVKPIGLAGLRHFMFATCDRVGEMPHFPSPRAGAAACVALVLRVLRARDRTPAWMDELMEVAKGSETGQGVFFFPKHTDDDEEDEEDEDEEEGQGAPTRDNTYVIWMDASFEAQRKRILQRCCSGVGEGPEIQRRLEKGNTDTGNLKAMLFGEEYDAVKASKRRKTPAELLATMLALTVVMAEDNYWLHDNECVADALDLIRKLGNYWKALLKLDTQQLALCHPRSTQQQEQQPEQPEQPEQQDQGPSDQEVRGALYAVLDWCRSQFAEAAGEVEFKYEPPKSRKKKSAANAAKAKRPKPAAA